MESEIEKAIGLFMIEGSGINVFKIHVSMQLL